MLPEACVGPLVPRGILDSIAALHNTPEPLSYQDCVGVPAQSGFPPYGVSHMAGPIVSLSVAFATACAVVFGAAAAKAIASECKVFPAETFDYLKSNEVAIESEAELSSMTTLNLGGRKVGDADLKYLCHLPSLEALYLYNQSSSDGGLSGATLDELASLRRLRILDLDGNRVSSAHLHRLGDLHALRQLRLYNNPLGGPGIGALSKLPALESLLLQRNHLKPGSIGELSQLGALKNFRSLTLVDQELAEADLEVLGELRQIRDLTVQSAGMKSGESLQYISLLTQLEGLSLGNQPTAPRRKDTIGDKDNLNFLARMANLRMLALPWLDLEDDDLPRFVGGLTRIETLDLSGNPRLTDGGLRPLLSLRSLKCIGTDLGESPIAVADNAVREMLRRRGVKVVFNVQLCRWRPARP